MTLKDYWRQLGMDHGKKMAFAREIGALLNNDEDAALSHMNMLVRAGKNANPTIKTAKAIRDVSGGVVDLDSWL